MISPRMRYKPVVLIVLDGFGIAPPAEGNAIQKAKMPVFHRLIESYPAMTLQASGAAVGLSWGEVGNSEVGHLTIGAGRIFYQSLPRINLAIESGEFFQNPALKKILTHVQTMGGKLHLIGLVSPGGVHASQDHLYALLDWCAREKFSRVFVHAMLDGRDTRYNLGAECVQALEQKMAEIKTGAIASLSGRFYAMDRDNRWERVQAAYAAMALGEGEKYASASEAIQASYARGVYDEQLVPAVIARDGAPVATVGHGDGIIFFNFRPDRARELTKAFVLPTFHAFPRAAIQNLICATFTEYEKDLPVEIVFPPQRVESCLARLVSDAGLHQLHIAETEKYAHITFFLNAMREEPFPGEERVIIPSPRVSSYDQEPAMSALLIAERAVKEIAAGSEDFIAVNLANPDMVGHTGNEAATIQACEVTDTALGQIVDAALAVGGAVVVTADHGNAEEIKNLVTGEMDKEHSTNPVPCLIVAKAFEGMKAPTGDVVGGDLSFTPPVGMLADIAPTVCKLLEIQPAPEMTGRSLI